MADDDLFHRAMKDTRPLRGRRSLKPATTKPAPKPAASVSRAVVPAPAAPDLPDLDPRSATGLDRATEEGLRRGKLVPDASIDLHGHTLAEAERALARFLERAQASGARVALVVTGKAARQDEGNRPVGGRIHAEFPHWLNRPENRGRVIGVRPANPRHGGGGAFYVLLRRPR
ncbi:MAG: Smr/MutS family protein [Alphaproteobacteria bacterium]|nr:Smr/MutS family protein [Alphaproteobacteria bacterium]